MVARLMVLTSKNDDVTDDDGASSTPKGLYNKAQGQRSATLG
jgi:hypothetical protein